VHQSKSVLPKTWHNAVVLPGARIRRCTGYETIVKAVRAAAGRTDAGR
jgi:hypothetical protein